MPGYSDELREMAARLHDKMQALGLMMACAESCTGGMLAALMTEREGASEIFERGFVTYSNDAKMELLGVPADTLRAHGAVSPQTATAMVRGAIKNSRAEIALSITGIAGPGGGSAEKPVGLVYIGYGTKEGVTQCGEHRFTGTRDDIRRQSVEAALKHLIKLVDTLA